LSGSSLISSGAAAGFHKPLHSGADIEALVAALGDVWSRLALAPGRLILLHYRCSAV
jgi:hypothetical protein